MKGSTFAAIVFVIVGVVGVTMIVRYKARAQAALSAMDAGLDAAPR